MTDDDDLDDGEVRDPVAARPDLEGMGQPDVALLLDEVAEGVDSWRLLWLRLHERIGLGIVAERGISPGCPMDVALDAVKYLLDFSRMLAVGGGARASQAAHALREQAVQCGANDAPGLEVRGVVILAAVLAWEMIQTARPLLSAAERPLLSVV